MSCMCYSYLHAMHLCTYDDLVKLHLACQCFNIHNLFLLKIPLYSQTCLSSHLSIAVNCLMQPLKIPPPRKLLLC